VKRLEIHPDGIGEWLSFTPERMPASSLSVAPRSLPVDAMSAAAPVTCTLTLPAGVFPDDPKAGTFAPIGLAPASGAWSRTPGTVGAMSALSVKVDPDRRSAPDARASLITNR
jgi:hypothetical protein